MPALHDVAEGLLVALVYLVDEQQHGYGHLGHLGEEVGVLLGVFHHVGDIEQHVGIGKGRLREGQHHLLHLVVGLEHSGSVREDYLAVVVVDDAHDAVTGGLGLEGSDADALAYELVHQRRFTHVGVAYDIYKSCFVHSYIQNRLQN